MACTKKRFSRRLDVSVWVTLCVCGVLWMLFTLSFIMSRIKTVSEGACACEGAVGLCLMGLFISMMAFSCVYVVFWLSGSMV